MGCENANIKVSPSELHFEVQEGWSFIPPYQYLRIEKDGPGMAPLFTVSTEHSTEQSLLSLSHRAARPAINLRVGWRSIGLEAGLYTETLVIESSVEVDNPRVPVFLRVIPREEPSPPEPPEEPPDPEPPVVPEPDPEPAPEPDPDPPRPDIEPPLHWFWVWILRILRRIGFH